MLAIAANLIILVFTQTGCNKFVIKSMPKLFPQGKKDLSKYESSFKKVKKIACLDSFSTEANFYVLPMLDDVCAAYADMKYSKGVSGDEDREQFLLRHLEENKRNVVMYVVTDIRDPLHTSLADSFSSWALSLKTDKNELIGPSYCKSVEIPTEIRAFFGEALNTLNPIYLMKFPRHNKAGEPYNYSFNNKEITLVLSSIGLKREVSWPKHTVSKKTRADKKTVKNKDKSKGHSEETKQKEEKSEAKIEPPKPQEENQQRIIRHPSGSRQRRRFIFRIP